MLKTHLRFLSILTCRTTCRCENALKCTLLRHDFSTLLLLHENLTKYSSFWIFTFRRKCSIMSTRNAIVSRPRMHDGHLFLRTIKLMIDSDAEIGHRRCFFICFFGVIFDSFCFYCIKTGGFPSACRP